MCVTTTARVCRTVQRAASASAFKADDDARSAATALADAEAGATLVRADAALAREAAVYLTNERTMRRRALWRAGRSWRLLGPRPPSRPACRPRWAS